MTSQTNDLLDAIQELQSFRSATLARTGERTIYRKFHRLQEAADADGMNALQQKLVRIHAATTLSKKSKEPSLIQKLKRQESNLHFSELQRSAKLGH